MRGRRVVYKDTSKQTKVAKILLNSVNDQAVHELKYNKVRERYKQQEKLTNFSSKMTETGAQLMKNKYQFLHLIKLSF